MLARKSIKLQTSLSNPQHRGWLEVRTWPAEPRAKETFIWTGEKKASVVSTRLWWLEEQVRRSEECFGAGETLRRRSYRPCARSSVVRGLRLFEIAAH